MLQRLFAVVLRGAVIWLIPFLVSFFFYAAPGQLATSYALFKSVMVMILTWTIIAVNLRPPQRVASWLVGIVYLGVNILLDVLIVVPLTGMDATAYVEQIGLMYLLIPTITLVMQRDSGRIATPA